MHGKAGKWSTAFHLAHSRPTFQSFSCLGYEKAPNTPSNSQICSLCASYLPNTHRHTHPLPLCQMFSHLYDSDHKFLSQIDSLALIFSFCIIFSTYNLSWTPRGYQGTSNYNGCLSKYHLYLPQGDHHTPTKLHGSSAPLQPQRPGTSFPQFVKWLPSTKACLESEKQPWAWFECENHCVPLFAKTVTLHVSFQFLDPFALKKHEEKKNRWKEMPHTLNSLIHSLCFHALLQNLEDLEKV